MERSIQSVIKPVSNRQGLAVFDNREAVFGGGGISRFAAIIQSAGVEVGIRTGDDTTTRGPTFGIDVCFDHYHGLDILFDHFMRINRTVRDWSSALRLFGACWRKEK